MTRPNKEVEFAFRKCGPLNPNVSNPFAPIIRKPKQHITSGLRHKIDTHAVVNRLTLLFGNIIECPLELIPKLDTLLLTDRQKAHYFKALYQSLAVNKSYADMYNKYYKDSNCTSIKPYARRNFILSCKNNPTPLRNLYEREYCKYSRFDS